MEKTLNSLAKPLKQADRHRGLIIPRSGPGEIQLFREQREGMSRELGFIPGGQQKPRYGFPQGFASLWLQDDANGVSLTGLKQILGLESVRLVQGHHFCYIS